MTARISHFSLHQLGLEPYSRAIFKQGLKARKAEGDSEENEVLDRAMEYTGVVGVELEDMLASVNSKVKDLAPQVPVQHTLLSSVVLSGKLGGLPTELEPLVCLSPNR